MKKLLIAILAVFCCISMKSMQPTEEEKKKQMLEYDLMRWKMWIDYGVRLDMPAYKYFSKDGKFIGSRCNCIEEKGDCGSERMTSEEWHEKLRILEKKL